MKRIILLLLACFSALYSIAQTSGDAIAPDAFDGDKLGTLILGGVNDIRWKNGSDSMQANDVLSKAAASEAGFFADRSKISIDPGQVGLQVKKNGGTKNAEEVGFDVNIAKGKNYITYSQAAQDVITKLNKSKKNLDIVNNPKFFYCGINAQVSQDGKKAYVSIVLGGLDAFNDGKKYKKDLTLKYTTGKKGLQTYDSKSCKSCEKFSKELDALQEHIYIKDNLVYLESNNFKIFKKLFKGDHDGLAVDIIQKAQYPCTGPIIRDNNQLSHGILLKPIYKKAILKKNEYQDKKTTQYKGVIGKLPKSVQSKLPADGYELNLLYIADKHLCKTIIRKYTESDSAGGVTDLGIFPDTLVSNDKERFNPAGDNQIVEFKIPYKQGTATYTKTDIESFIKALNEPQFTITGISIVGHSSLEGDSLTNARLQRQRAQVILAAINQYAQAKIGADVQKIETNDSWDLFQEQVAKTEFKDLAKMPKRDVIKQINSDAALASKLAPILQDERFASITMAVKYDMAKVGEENVVYNQYKKFIDKKRPAEALKAQKFIISKIIKSKYNHKRLLDIQVPNDPAYANITVNNLFVYTRYEGGDTISTDTRKKLTEIAAKANTNDFANYNKVVCDVILNPLTDEKSINTEQKEIDDLRGAKAIPQAEIDKVDLEHQLKVISVADTAVDPTKNSDVLVQKSIDRIKKMFDIKGNDWHNNLKLAYVFLRHNDLTFALKLLQPYISDPNADENLLFTYISIASHNQDNVYSRTFRLALSRAAAKNPARYCKLFGAPYLSFQIKENPNVRKAACDICGAGK